MDHIKTFDQLNEEQYTGNKPKGESKKLMRDMSKDEKIAVYRERISKERAKPAPDMGKIGKLNALIDKLNEKPKPKKK